MRRVAASVIAMVCGGALISCAATGSGRMATVDHNTAEVDATAEINAVKTGDIGGQKRESNAGRDVTNNTVFDLGQLSPPLWILLYALAERIGFAKRLKDWVKGKRCVANVET